MHGARRLGATMHGGRPGARDPGVRRFATWWRRSTASPPLSVAEKNRILYLGVASVLNRVRQQGFRSLSSPKSPYAEPPASPSTCRWS